MIQSLRVFSSCIALFSALTGFGHGDWHERIDRITRRIEFHPDNADLFLERAELRRLDQQFSLALDDCHRAKQLLCGIAVELLEGKILADSGQDTRACAHLDRFLSSESKNVEALIARARVLTKLHRSAAAAADYSMAISVAAAPEPDFYLERARLWQNRGEWQRALDGLDEGIRRLGPIASLELPAVEMELHLRKFDSALTRIESLAAQSQRKEFWLARRGEILERALRLREAQSSYRQAAAAIDHLPTRLQEDASVKELRAQMTFAIARIEKAN